MEHNAIADGKWRAEIASFSSVNGGMALFTLERLLTNGGRARHSRCEARVVRAHDGDVSVNRPLLNLRRDEIGRGNVHDVWLELGQALRHAVGEGVRKRVLASKRQLHRRQWELRAVVLHGGRVSHRSKNKNLQVFCIFMESFWVSHSLLHMAVNA